MTELLEVRNVVRIYSMGGFFARHRIRAVDGISLTVEDKRPEILSIIGESGSGKTTLARMILHTVAPSSGTIFFRGADLESIRGRKQRLAFMRQVQPIFQNPFEAFNPLKRVDRYLFATARNIAGLSNPSEIEDASDRALKKVGLSLVEVRGRYPHELSGGQLQRVAIARALIPTPSLLIADEPVSMVDASLRVSIVNLLRGLRDNMGISIIYITHDLATAYYISDRIMIMHRGKVVESGEARAVLDNPQHPYSIRLKQAVLSPDPDASGGRRLLRESAGESELDVIEAR
jgi:ABC-type oligopeptide transport system ATPase subunit